MADSCGIAELKETIEKVNAELNQLRTKISELNAKVREQEECLSNAQTEMSNQREENAQAQTEMSNLREENAQAQAEMCNLREENAQDQTEISNLREENAEAQTEMSNLREENAQAQTEISNLREENAQAQTEISNLREENAQLASSLKEVSIGSAGTMADSCYIAELKETVEKMNTELFQSHTKISEQKEGLSAAQKEISNLREENAQLAIDLKESEEKCRAVLERLELAEQKLSQFSQKPDAAAEECLPQVNETNGDDLKINSLPNEIILEVFSYLEQNQLGQVARVCRRWSVLTKSPILWKMVNVKFSPSHRYQYTVAESFINRLPFCVSSIRLDFMEYEEWIEPLRFVKFCEKLRQKCPHLEKLMLINSKLYDILPSVIDVCTLFLQDVKNLVFHHCIFFGYPVGREFGCASKIEVLDLSYSLFEPTYAPQFSKMPCLKVLCLSGTYICDSWFKDDSSFLNQLHVLNVGYTNVIVISLPALQNHGHNLKELYLCKVDLRGLGITLNNSTSPHLKTICLSYTYVTCEDVVSLIQSCPSLENVYVHEDVAESFAAHPFIVANRCKLGIVKTIGLIHEHNADYLHS